MHLVCRIANGITGVHGGNVAGAWFVDRRHFAVATISNGFSRGRLGSSMTAIAVPVIVKVSPFRTTLGEADDGLPVG